MARNLTAARTVSALNELAAAIRKGVRYSKVVVDTDALTVTVNDVVFGWHRDEENSRWSDFDQLEGWAVFSPEATYLYNCLDVEGIDTAIQAKNLGRQADERRWR